MPNDDLLKMTVAASKFGWTVPVAEAEWPQTLIHDDTEWTKDEMTLAGNGEVQCVNYTDGKENWLVVWNE